jgi:hypothetical protein
MKSVVFWDMMPCSLLSFNRRFGVKEIIQQEPASKQVATCYVGAKCEEEYIFRVSADKMLKKIFGKFEKVIYEELHSLHSSDIVMVIKQRRVERLGLIRCIEEAINAYKLLLGNLQENKALGRFRCRWQDVILYLL